MGNPFVCRATVAVWPLCLVAACAAAEGLWVDPRCQAMPTDKMGPFVRLGDGGILAAEETQAAISRDDGKTWESHPLFQPGQNFKVRPERALLRTRNGAVILAFMNDADQMWRWDEVKKDADPGVRLPTCAIRSLDEGKTWQDLQVLHTEWTGCIRNMIQTRTGRVIFSSMKLLHNPGRHGVITYSSTDDGKTWTPSNLIDLGGNGHHDGVTEATIEELGDGRLLMLMRTNWDRFWLTISEDDGQSWWPMGPSSIPASSAPGLLKRLQDGRLMLVWNRPYPEGKNDFPRTGGDGQWSAVPAINHRAELSIAFSGDDGKTWSTPAVIARQPGKWLAYPYAFERAPGELWITTMQGDVRVALREADFLK